MQNRKALLFAFLSLPLACRFGFGEETGHPPAFEVGEKLSYSLGWQFIVAGHASIEVLPDEEIDGRKVRSFTMTAKTNWAADPFFKVRDKLSSLAEYDVSRSLGYSKIQREGKTQHDISVEFDWETLTAHYQETLKGSNREIPILENTLDPLSAFYFIRMQDFDVGSVIKGPLTDGKRCNIAQIEVVAREKIKVNGTTYDTFKMIPDFKDVGGVFERSENASVEIWVTADYRHIPVKMKSEVAVGSFVAELEN
ncbi:MAG: DUF3108 domain-containing protein [Kiritimatiellales bacterium]|nr:DUF3108 domain-containing protein [Kiritimatiellales bacterium]